MPFLYSNTRPNQFDFTIRLGSSSSVDQSKSPGTTYSHTFTFNYDGTSREYPIQLDEV